MSFSKLPQLALYIVVGISVLVIAFFYFGDNMIDMDAYNAKVQKMNAANESSAFNFMQDLQTPVADSMAQEMDSTTVAAAEGMAGGESGQVASEEQEEVKFTFMEKLVDKKTDIAIGWSYILVIITLLIALGFSLVQMFENTKALIRGLIVLVGVAILVGIAYMLGSDTPIHITGYEGTDNSDPKVLKMIDMGLISTYFVLGMILIAILYSEISKYFK